MDVLRLVVMGLVSFTVLAVGVAMGRRDEPPGVREQLDKLFGQGNFKDAYEGYRKLALDAKTESHDGGNRPEASDPLPRESRAGR